jgi:hypothetical protein
MNMNMEVTVQNPKKAGFRDIANGNFCTIDIGEHPTKVTIIISGSPQDKMGFLMQLAGAVGKAIQFESDKLEVSSE